MSSSVNKFLLQQGDSDDLPKGAESPFFCMHNKFNDALIHTEKASRIIETSSKTPDSASKAIYELLLAQYALRDVIGTNTTTRSDRCEIDAQSVPDSICTITTPKNCILQITYPFLLGLHIENNDIMANIIEKSIGSITRYKLNKFIAENPKTIFPSGFLYLIFKRFIPQNGDKLLVSDSNNLETGAITNAVSQVIGRSDNAYSMGFIYTAETNDSLRTEVTLIHSESLPLWENYLNI